MYIFRASKFPLKVPLQKSKLQIKNSRIKERKKWSTHGKKMVFMSPGKIWAGLDGVSSFFYLVFLMAHLRWDLLERGGRWLLQLICKP